jgi:broad specificity phosphatase PhoE
LISLYLFRHGQAGTRTDYDTLSELGRRQSRLLGESLVAQQVHFTAAFSGELSRQQQTAAAVGEAYAGAGVPFPAIETDDHWNEFDLDAVYRDLAPVLAAGDPQFRVEHEEMLRHSADQSHSIHRRWTRCDLMVLRAWVAGSHPSTGETWQAFQERVTGSRDRFSGFSSGANVAVFTSATPMGVWAGVALGADSRTVVRLAGALYNSAYLVLRLRQSDLSLFSFNNVPHLNDPALRTFR